MRSYIFTRREVELLKAWLEEGLETQETRKLLSRIRINLPRLTQHILLMTRAARRLQALGRWDRRFRLPSKLSR